MKTPRLFSLFAALALALPAVRAADEPAARSGPLPTLAIVISENLGRRATYNDDFHRLDMAFKRVAKERKWPVTIVVERFAANVPEYDTELSIFLQPLRQEMPGEFTLRAWTTLKVDGKKHDFGIVKYGEFRRLGERMDESIEKIFIGYANAAADKIEPVLFPKKEVSAQTRKP
jgi:hypothetical protein